MSKRIIFKYDDFGWYYAYLVREMDESVHKWYHDLWLADR